MSSILHFQSNENVILQYLVAYFFFFRLTFVRMGLFCTAHKWGGVKSTHPPPPSSLFHKVCHTYPTMMKLGKVTSYLKKIKWICINQATHPLISADISIYYYLNKHGWYFDNVNKIFFSRASLNKGSLK